MSSFTNFSSNNFFLFFAEYPKSPYKSHLSRHTSESLKNVVKILETRSQNQLKCPKMDQNLSNS